jgi:signal transduction histidine kinase
MLPVPLRVRLTLWYSFVLAGVLALFGLAVYGMLVNSLTAQIDRTLKEAANTIVATIQLDPFLLPTMPPVGRLGLPGLYAQVWRPDLTLHSETNNLLPYTSEPLDAEALKYGRPALRNVYVGEAHLRVLTSPVTTIDGTLVAYVQTATGLESVDIAKRTLVLVLVLGGCAAVMASAIVSSLSAGRALRPLNTITQTALQITRADDLSRRIPLPPGGPRDEVGRLAQAFNESLERLEKLFNAQRRFLADVSHELRTPLTAIRGNVDLLRRMGGADPTSLDAIQSEAERMSRLVGDILLLAQAETGNLPLVNVQVELDTLLLEVFREAQVLSAGVHVHIGEIDQALVLGDRDRLKQLLLNLVSNALKFTPEGGRVTLGLARVNDWARLTVADTGSGVPPTDLPRIFERFYRVDKARSRTLGGAGLGLSIAQRIAQMHGGRIEAASDGVSGHGATFSVWLPLAPAGPSHLAQTAPHKAVPAKALPFPFAKSGEAHKTGR